MAVVMPAERPSFSFRSISGRPRRRIGVLPSVLVDQFLGQLNTLITNVDFIGPSNEDFNLVLRFAAERAVWRRLLVRAHSSVNIAITTTTPMIHLIARNLPVFIRLRLARPEQ
jgi:hypothetical protein